MDDAASIFSRALKGGGGGPGVTDLQFPHVSLFFVIGSWLSATIYILTLMYLRRSRGRNKWNDEDGLFVLSEWPEVIRMIAGFIWMFMIGIPAVLLTNGWVWGGLIALVEKWALDDGYYYVIANILGLFNALTNATPETPSGQYMALIISIYALIVTVTAVGFLTMLQFVVWQSDDVPDTTCGLLRYVFVYIPCGLLLCGTAMGGLVAGVEGWSFSDGFFHMSGTLCAIANPIDDQTITTQSGMFAESYCACLNLGVMAMVITIVTQHPDFFKLVRIFEGKFDDYFQKRQSYVMKYNAQKMHFEDKGLEEIRKAKQEADAAIKEFMKTNTSTEVYTYMKSLESECRTLQYKNSRLRSKAQTPKRNLTKELSGELGNTVTRLEEPSIDIPGSLPGSKASETVSDARSITDARGSLADARSSEVGTGRMTDDSTPPP